MALSGLALILATVNLVSRGRGAPFAIAITRVIVTDWMYAWTRNPMILSALALLVGLGIYLGSGLFLVWVLAVVSPAVLVFLRFYEERELEIRFGNEYMNYRSKTPRLIPRRPESKD
jgi:protein-S-isoprenylcysteine O-methyltransferase Ste14